MLIISSGDIKSMESSLEKLHVKISHEITDKIAAEKLSEQTSDFESESSDFGSGSSGECVLFLG